MKRFRIGVVCFLILACLLFNSCFIVIKNDAPNTVTYTVKFSTYSAPTGENITAGSLINETTLSARRVQLYSELMQTTSYYETLHNESNVNMTAEEIGQALMFEPVDNKGLLYVYITASKANAKALAQAIVDTATPYLETITANVVLTCVEPPSLLRNDQSCFNKKYIFKNI